MTSDRRAEMFRAAARSIDKRVNLQERWPNIDFESEFPQTMRDAANRYEWAAENIEYFYSDPDSKVLKY